MLDLVSSINLPAFRGLILGVKENLLPEAAEELKAGLEAKRDRFFSSLSKRTLKVQTREGLESLLKEIYPVRRLSQKILEENGEEGFRREVFSLLYGWKGVEKRMARFMTEVKIPHDNPAIGRDLATELLHYTAPEEYWLWTRWIWDPKIKAGALCCMMEFVGKDRTWEKVGFGEDYKTIGRQLGSLQKLLQEEGWGVDGPFGVDIFLAYLYADYFYKLFLATSKSLSGMFAKGFNFIYKLLGVPQVKMALVGGG